MSTSGSDSSSTTEVAPYRDAPTTLLRFPLPSCTPLQFHDYLTKTADMILDYHNERKACEEHGTQWQPDDALHETVYQTQLLTMAFLDGHYRTPALVIETINNFQRRAVVQLAILLVTPPFITSIRCAVVCSSDTVDGPAFLFNLVSPSPQAGLLPPSLPPSFPPPFATPHPSSFPPSQLSQPLLALPAPSEPSSTNLQS